VNTVWEDRIMNGTRNRIERVVMRIQNDFINTPWLALTLPGAQRRFRVDEMTCEAVLDALTDAHVLSKSRQGVYTRDFPITPRRASIRRSARRAA
jgi:hypothetical protein